jgi:hypothetical protein
MTATIYPESKFTVRREIRKVIPTGTPGLRVAEQEGLAALARTGLRYYATNRGLRAMQSVRSDNGSDAA